MNPLFPRHFLHLAIALFVFNSHGLLGKAPAQEPQPQSEGPVLSLLTDRFEVEIDKQPDIVWAHLKRLYVDGDRYRQRGLEVNPLTNDPSAHLGGLHVKSKEGGPKVELNIRFSTIDDESRFLANYLEGTLPQATIPKGIYVTHDVIPTNNGCRYCVIIQTFVEVQLDESQEKTREAINDWMQERLKGHKEGLKATVMNEIVNALDKN